MDDLKGRLLSTRLDQADVDIPGLGTVRVRALTRAEAISVRKATDREDTMDGLRLLILERKMLAAALIDPPMTEDEVRQWQQAAPAGELDPVVARVQELSGMVEGAQKAAYKSVRRDPGSGVRLLPSGQTVDDGGPAASGDG